MLAGQAGATALAAAVVEEVEQPLLAAGPGNQFWPQGGPEAPENAVGGEPGIALVESERPSGQGLVPSLLGPRAEPRSPASCCYDWGWPIGIT